MGFDCYFEILFYIVCVTIIPPYSDDQLTSSNNNTEVEVNPLTTLCTRIVEKQLSPYVDGTIPTKKVKQVGNRFQFKTLITYAERHKNDKLIRYIDLKPILEMEYKRFIELESFFIRSLMAYDYAGRGVVTKREAYNTMASINLFGNKLLGNFIKDILVKYTYAGDEFKYKDMLKKIITDIGDNIINSSKKG
ncbi:uncharacterized protein LOC126909282 [Daktulosphaira vitifoliae]|uniref:uncharacterized protein LOC126909282 n=1 Tax=Daktulosphaira vitifoliae TaxID=58002 RepID=UPI0021AA1506|nr:uncharacterized protein LOC126909282 [Daktulosphaira vitifoliae]